MCLVGLDTNLWSQEKEMKRFDIDWMDIDGLLGLGNVCRYDGLCDVEFCDSAINSGGIDLG